jgi:hypothetical protein
MQHREYELVCWGSNNNGGKIQMVDLFDVISSEEVDYEMVGKLLESSDLEDIENGKTVLMKAVMFDKVKIVEMLIKAGANVNAQCYGNTALHMATLYNNLLCMKLLLDAGADLDIRDRHGKTAIEAIKGLIFEKKFKALIKQVRK